MVPGGCGSDDIGVGQLKTKVTAGGSWPLYKPCSAIHCNLCVSQTSILLTHCNQRHINTFEMLTHFKPAGGKPATLTEQDLGPTHELIGTKLYADRRELHIWPTKHFSTERIKHLPIDCECDTCTFLVLIHGTLSPRSV